MRDYLQGHRSEGAPSMRAADDKAEKRTMVDPCSMAFDADSVEVTTSTRLVSDI